MTANGGPVPTADPETRSQTDGDEVFYDGIDQVELSPPGTFRGDQDGYYATTTTTTTRERSYHGWNRL